MDVEIYMPCEPEWFCDGLLILFAFLFIVGLLGFWALYLSFIESTSKSSELLG